VDQKGLLGGDQLESIIELPVAVSMVDSMTRSGPVVRLSQSSGT